MTGDDEIPASTQRATVRDRYGSIVTEESSGCCGTTVAGERAAKMGYDEEDIQSIAGNLGLGCGNPRAIADLSSGQTVLDLGSGVGFDCFLAANEVGPTGHVIGVDMTPEMIEQARENADDHENVEFRLGEIEHLPVANNTIDVVISNCVINLSPEKQQVFNETHRVLRPGGSIAVSDVVQIAPLPRDLHTNPTALASCIAGAATITELETYLDEAGFTDISVRPQDGSESLIQDWSDEINLEDALRSAHITAKTPQPSPNDPR